MVSTDYFLFKARYTQVLTAPLPFRDQYMIGKKQRESQPKVAIITPTRGLVFSEVIEYIEAVRTTYPHIRLFMSHNFPIPDCFNALVQRALDEYQPDYLWFIEEDTVPPAKALDAFLEAVKECDIAAIDYGFNGGWNTIVRRESNDEILFTGFGCTFMKAEIFKDMEQPFFRADRAFNISNMQWMAVEPSKVYGMYDIDWGFRMREAGKIFYQVPGECRHLQLISLGQKEVNNGLHVLGEKDRISKPLKINI